MSEEPLLLVDEKVLRIRPASQDDLDRLLWGGEHLRANRQAQLELQERGELVLLLPTLDDEPIGHLALDLVRLQDTGGVYLYWFEVRQEFRGRGIGTAVIKRAEQIAAEKGYSFSEIAVEKDNDEARLLYERLGYRLIGEREDHWFADLPNGGQIEVIDNNWVLQKTLGEDNPDTQTRPE